MLHIGDQTPTDNQLKAGWDGDHPPKVWLRSDDATQAPSGLNCSRVFGAWQLRDHGIEASPHCSEFQVTPGQHVLLIGSRGFWEFISLADATTVILTSQEPAEVTHALVRLAARQWAVQEGANRRPDISVMVIEVDATTLPSRMLKPGFCRLGEGIAAVGQPPPRRTCSAHEKEVTVTITEVGGLSAIDGWLCVKLEPMQGGCEPRFSQPEFTSIGAPNLPFGQSLSFPLRLWYDLEKPVGTFCYCGVRITLMAVQGTVMHQLATGTLDLASHLSAQAEQVTIKQDLRSGFDLRAVDPRLPAVTSKVSVSLNVSLKQKSSMPHQSSVPLLEACGIKDGVLPLHLHSLRYNAPEGVQVLQDADHVAIRIARLGSGAEAMTSNCKVNGTLCEFEWQEELKLSVPSQPAHSRQGFECLELHVELLTQDGGILGAGVLDVSKYITAACWEAPDVVVNLGAPDACMQGSAGLLRLNVKLDVLGVARSKIRGICAACAQANPALGTEEMQKILPSPSELSRLIVDSPPCT